MIGLFEPVCAPWKVDGVPEDFSFGELAARLGPHGPVRREGDEARADLARDRRAQVLLRPGELHAGPAADRRRGAGAAATTSSPRASTRSASSPAAASAACWRTGSSTAGPTSTSPASTSTGCTATRRTPSTGARARSSRSGMVYQCHYPTRSMQTARGAKQLAAPRPARRAAAPTSGRERLGGRRLVRARRASSRRSRRSRGAGRTGSRTGRPSTGRARGRHPHGHVVHVEVPGAGPRRRPRARPHLGERRRRRSRA